MKGSEGHLPREATPGNGIIEGSFSSVRAWTRAPRTCSRKNPSSIEIYTDQNQSNYYLVTHFTRVLVGHMGRRGRDSLHLQPSPLFS